MAALITFDECWLDPNLYGAPASQSPLSGFPEYQNEHAQNPKTGIVQTNIGRLDGIEMLNLDLRLLNDTERAYFLNFYRGGYGSGVGFRCRVPYDYTATLEVIAAPSGAQAIADGAKTAFNLYKTYKRPGGTRTVVRRICKPVATAHLGGGSVTLYNGDGVTARTPTTPFAVYFNLTGTDVLQSSGWTIDNTTGILTFSSPPGIGNTIKWSGEFDIPAAFLPPPPNQQYDITSDITNVGVREILSTELGISF
jgi:hypothetical protein